MTDERRPVHRMEGPGRRRGVPAACLLLAMLGLLRAAVPAAASANLRVSPGIIDFGLVPVGGSSTMSFTLVNAPGFPPSFTGTINITGNLPGSEFTIQSSSVSPIIPGGSVTWNLTFHPTQLETFNNLFIDFQDPNSTTVRVTVRGFSAGPTFTVNSSSLSFGQVQVGQVKLRVVTVSNTGTGVLHINNLQLSGRTPGDFQARFSGGGGTASIPDGGSAAIDVTFAPGAAGARGAQLEIDDDAGGPHFVDLSGTGVGPPSSQLIVSPDILDFGAVNVGSSLTLGFTLKNIGNGPTGNIQVASNLSSTQFTIPVNSISPIAPAISTTWSVTFHPTTVGIMSGYVRFGDPNGGAGAGLVTVNVQGRGAAPPPPADPTVTPPAIDFGAAVVGGLGLTNQFQIRNNSTSTLTITLVTMAGANKGDFQLGAYPTSITANSSGSVSVTFLPQSAGAKSATVDIATLIPGFPPKVDALTVPLSGTGVAPPLPPAAIGVSPNTLDFGQVTVGTQATRNFTVTSRGGSNLLITGVENDLDGTQFSIGGSGGGAPIPPGGSQTWTVTFHPTQAAIYDTSIALDHNAAGSPTRIFIKGTAVVAPPPTPAPAITGYAPTTTRTSIVDGPPGAPLLILGSNLGTSGTVAFNGLPAGAALSWSSSEIVVVIPTAPSYPYSGPVTVTVNGQTATGPTFTIVAPVTPTPTPGLMGGDWPVFMQGPTQSGRAGFTLDPLTLSPWSVSLGSKPGASPVMAGGVAYIGTESNGLFAIDTATHKVRWNQVLGAPIRSAPAVGPQTIVVAATNGLYGLNPQDGAVRWGPRKEITPFGTVSPMIVGNTVYLGGPGPGGFANALYAVNASTGELVWPAPASLPAAALSTVAVDTDRGLLFVALGQPPAPGLPLAAPSAVLALRLADGSMAWPAVVLPVPAAAGLSLGQVAGAGGAVPAVFVAAGSTVTALDATKGSTLWSRSLLPETGLQGPPVVSSVQPGATLYVRSSQGRIYALAADSGADAAGGRSSTLAPITGTLALAGKLLLAPTETGLVAVDVTTGTPVWTGDAPGASGVAIAGNSLLLGTADGRLVGYSGTVIPLP